MSKSIDFEFNKVCRTCLIASDEMKSLYESSSKSCLAEMLMSFTPLKYSENDGYPTTICHHCITDISKCYAFRLKCLESDDILRKHVQRAAIAAAANTASDSTTTTKSLNPPMKLPELNHVMHIKIEMEDDLNVAYDYKIRAASPQQITSVSNVFNNHLPNKTSVSGTLPPHCSDVSTQLLDQHLIKVEEDVVDSRVFFEEMPIKCESSVSPENSRIIEEEFNSNIVRIYCQGSSSNSNSVQQSNTTEKCLKDPLTITEIQELNIVKKQEQEQQQQVDDKQEKEKKHSCTVCNKTYTRNSTLKIHMRTHTGERFYSCTFCDKSFNRRQPFTAHIRMHTGEKPYTCTVCNTSFGHKKSLRFHMNKHTGEKLHPCTICDRSFNTSYYLTSHMRTHTGEKPFECTVCNMSFRLKHNLKLHMLTHTQEKPYTCTVCNKSYKHNQRLKQHMLTHAGQKPYTCTLCNNAYTQNKNLKRHMLSHSSVKSTTITLHMQTDTK